MIITTFGQAIGIGGASIISRSLGSNEKDKAILTLNNLLHSVVIVNIIVITIAFIYLEPLLRVFGAGDEFIDLAIDYARITLIGSFAMNIINVTMASVRAEGNTRYAMIVMMIGAVLNLIVDPIFIFVFHWGMKGAALATTMSQILGASMALWYYASGKGILHITKEKLLARPQWSILKESFSIGISSFIRHSATILIIILLNHRLLLYGETIAVAIFGIIFRLLMFNFMPVLGVNQGFMPIVGYNYGSQNYDRVHHVLKVAIKVTSLFSIFTFLVFFIFAKPLIAMFGNDAEVINLGYKAFRIIVVTLPIVSFQVIASGLYQALGKVWPSIFLAVFRQVLFLIPCVLILPLFYGLNGIWYAFPLSDFLAAIITLVMLLNQIKTLKEAQTSSIITSENNY